MNPIRTALRILASPCGTGEPATGDGSGAFDANVVATLSHLAEMISSAEDLVFGRTCPKVCRSTAHARASHLREFYRQANSGERNEVADDRKH